MKGDGKPSPFFFARRVGWLERLGAARAPGRADRKSSFQLIVMAIGVPPAMATNVAPVSRDLASASRLNQYSRSSRRSRDPALWMIRSRGTAATDAPKH